MQLNHVSSLTMNAYPLISMGVPSKLYMDNQQTAFFKEKLQTMESECLKVLAVKKQDRLVLNAQADCGDCCDTADKVIDGDITNSIIERLYKQLSEIRSALVRIDNGDYGYCEKTGDEIGIDRLKLFATARYTVETQSRLEFIKKHMGRQNFSMYNF